MTKHSVFFAATALLLTLGAAFAQNQNPQGNTNAPTPLQSATPDKPPAATDSEAATDVGGVPRRETTGQAPNVSKKMGAEMDSAGDQRASPDEQ